MLEVAAAIIRDGEKILICQRAEFDECNLLWEFPGGKKEHDEDLEDCVLREIREELNLIIKVNGVFAKTYYFYNGKDIKFTFFNSEIISGEMKLNVHKDSTWVNKGDLLNYTFMPADIEIVEMLSREKN